MTAFDPSRRATTRPVTLRWVVHLSLIATALVALVVEPVLTLHIGLGLAFVALVGAHLVQRRRASIVLLRRLGKPGELRGRPGGLALTDTVLLLVTAGMLASGLWDWAIGHPTRIRWHAVTGVVLAVYLVIHTVRRWSRLRRSQIR